MIIEGNISRVWFRVEQAPVAPHDSAGRVCAVQPRIVADGTRATSKRGEMGKGTAGRHGSVLLSTARTDVRSSNRSAGHEQKSKLSAAV